MKDKFEELKEKLEELKVKFSLMDPAVKHVVILATGLITTEIVLLSLDHAVTKGHVTLDINRKLYREFIDGKYDFLRVVDNKTGVVFIVTLEK